MSEMKPCPMCGATDLDMFVDIVQCRECGLTIAKDSAEEAIAAWNTRPGEDKLQDRVDALEWVRECEGIQLSDVAHRIYDPVNERLGRHIAAYCFVSLADEIAASIAAARAAVEVKQPNRAPGNVPELCEECGGNIADDQCQCGEAK